MKCTLIDKYLYQCQILALLSIVFVPYPSHDIPTGQIISIFRACIYYTNLELQFRYFKIASKSVQANCASRTYPGSVQFLLYHSGGISVSRVFYGFL